MNRFVSKVGLVVATFAIAQSALGGENAEKVANHFKQHGYQFGWSGGEANDDSGKDAKFFKVTDVTVDGNKIEMAYDWQNGKLKGELGKGRHYKGTWVQDNGKGEFQMTFSRNFNGAMGWWWTDEKKDKQRAFLK